MLLHMIIELIHLGIMKSLDIMSRSKSHIVHGNSRGKTLQHLASSEKRFQRDYVNDYVYHNHIDEATAVGTEYPTCNAF